MRTRILMILLALGAVLAACGVPSTGEFSAIDRSNVPAQLTATTVAPTTTTTTTTTIPSTSTTVVEAAVTTTTMEPATSTTTVDTERVTLWFLAGRELVKNDVQLSRPATAAQTMQRLELGPQGAGTETLRTAIPEGTVSLTTVRLGVITVDLDPEFFDRMTDVQDPRLAIAQIVLTLTKLSGVSQVRFTQNGEPKQVQLADGALSEPGQNLYYDDYVDRTNGSSPETPETTTTVAAPPEQTTTVATTPATG